MTELYFNINDVILILSIGLSIILALFQSVIAAKNKLSKYLLSAFFISIAISDIGVMLIWNEYLPKPGWIEKLVPYLYSFSTIIKGPLLVLYVGSITHQDFSLSKRNLFHLIPILIVFGCLYFFSVDINLMRLDTFGIDRAAYLTTDMIWWSLKLVPLAYFVFGLLIVHRYHKSVVSDNSDVNEQAIIWLYLLTLAFIGTSCWSVILSILALVYRLPYGVTENYLNFGLLIALFFYSASHAQKLTLTRKHSRASDISGNLKHIIDGIMTGINTDKLYLNQSINIEQFADKINLPARDVSFAINREFGTNFFEFINSYRVEEAKRYLADPQYADMSIMDILLESGFNSKSAFQRFFKRLTDLSPSEYRITHMSHKSSA
ncbi:helix-turn-helix domain-containing protein [Neptunicella sp.]|uniref:AraC family transcriptional regulator n=1 Tax=Neptunicella sp. TaxID=2125986 RepID=UPI003F693CF2